MLASRQTGHSGYAPCGRRCTHPFVVGEDRHGCMRSTAGRRPMSPTRTCRNRPRGGVRIEACDGRELPVSGEVGRLLLRRLLGHRISTTALGLGRPKQKPADGSRPLVRRPVVRDESGCVAVPRPETLRGNAKGPGIGDEEGSRRTGGSAALVAESEARATSCGTGAMPVQRQTCGVGQPVPSPAAAVALGTADVFTLIVTVTD